MLKIPATDNQTYNVPAWTEFKRWLRRFAYAYCILATAAAIGIYAYGKKSQNDTISKINALGRVGCLSNIKPDSILNKYNDFVQSVIEVRTEQFNRDLAKNDKAAYKADQKAIDRYTKDFAPIPTVAQCDIPVLK